MSKVHPNMVTKWKEVLQDEAATIFGKDRIRKKKEEENLVARLYQEIGQLKVAATSAWFNVRSVWWFSSAEELYRFLESEIGKIEGIRRSETFIGLHEEKRILSRLRGIVPESDIEKR
jgi:hypothetical protein